MLKKSLLLILSTTALFALDVDKSINKIKNVKSSDINVFVSGGVVENNFEPTNGSTGSGANLWMGSIGIEAFPNTLNLSASYGSVLQTKSLRKDYYDDYTAADLAYEDDMGDSDFIKLFIKPIKKDYGSFGFGYNKVSFVTEIFDEKGEGINVVDFKDVNQRVLHSGVTRHDRMNVAIESQELFLVYNYKKTPYGIKFGFEKGNKPIVLAEKYLAAKADYDGYKAAFGIFKTDGELKNGFNLKTLSLGYAIHDYDFYNHDLNKNETGDTTQISFNVEGGYKTKMFYFNMFANMKTEGDDISSGYTNPGDTGVEYIHLGMSLKATFNL